jgi:hypothetical protein
MDKSLPVLMVEGDNIAKVWEEAVSKLWEEGVLIYTEYEQWSRDCSMLMVIRKSQEFIWEDSVVDWKILISMLVRSLKALEIILYMRENAHTNTMRDYTIILFQMI